MELAGDDAKLGQVAASDVARLLIGVERALWRAASVIVGRPKLTAGRYEQVVERAVRLKLQGIEEGSVVPVLEIPDAPPESDELPIHAKSLGEAALDKLVSAADPQSHPHPVVATALLDLADTLRLGERYEAVTFESNGTWPHRRVRVDGEVRQRLRAYVDSAPPVPTRPDALVGVLVEADFERRTARLRTATEPAVQVSFDDDLADEIHLALRQQASFRGEVVFDPETNVAKSVSLRKIERGEQLVLGLDAEEFWRARTFEDLAHLQGGGQPADPDALHDADATDEERDAFMAALSELG